MAGYLILLIGGFFMKKMIQFLTLAFMVSALNIRADQEQIFVASNNLVMLGTGAAGLLAGIGVYCMADDYQSQPTRVYDETSGKWVKQKNKASKLKSFLIALPVAGAGALIVYKILDSYTPASWGNHLTKETKRLQGVAEKYKVGQGLYVTAFVDNASLQHVKTTDLPLVAAVEGLRAGANAADRIDGQLQALGNAESGMNDLVELLRAKTKKHGDGLSEAIVTVQKDGQYLKQLGVHQTRLDAAAARAVEAAKAAAQAEQARTARERNRLVQERNDIEAARLRQERGY
jgi:hypothetical protein